MRSDLTHAKTMSPRVDRLRRLLARHALDGLLVSGAANVTYLTGFTGTQGLVLVGRESLDLVVDFRYFEQAASQAPQAHLVHVDHSLYDDAVAEAVTRVRMRRLAFEADEASHLDYLRWCGCLPGCELVPSRGLVAEGRVIKDGTEIAALRRAATITSIAVATVLPYIRPGMTECDLAWEIDRNFQRLGAERPAFHTLVAGGQRAAMPHPRPTDRPLQEGDWVLIDAGARVAGYAADMTRTFVLGTPDPEQLGAWAAVRQALAAGIATIRPGVSARAIDAACRAGLAACGLASAFGHDSGHGVGLEVHESPRLAADSDDVLEADMVVTVEPGIYRPGWGGVRLEELVLVTTTGAEVLTTAPLSPGLLSNPWLGW